MTMNKTPKLLTLAIAAGLALTPWQALPAKSPRAAQADAEGRSTWIVVFEEPAIASFRGGKPSKDASASLAATTPAVTGAAKFDIAAPASRAYAAYLAQMRSERLTRAEVEFGRPLTPDFVYEAALNGVALALSADEAARMATMPGVSKVLPNWVSKPLTDAGPRWIKADQVWSGAAGVQSRGKGVVVGVIDTGINASHPSFSPNSFPGGPITNPRPGFLGLCASGGAACNGKLIGVYDFTTSSPAEPDNGLDVDGHGSHTASTAVGDPQILEFTADSGASVAVTVSGVAPLANLITYKACEQEASCLGTWLIKALDQATKDGVDVINYSIGGGANNPWFEPNPPPAPSTDALAMRGARDAGIVVVVAAGNDGPGAGTINSPANAPWVLAVAAATHNRLVGNQLILSGGVSPVPGAGVLVGASNTAGTASALELVLADVPLCGEGSDSDFPPIGASKPVAWGPNHFNRNQIVICERGFYARVAKSKNVDLAGGGGMVLINQQADGVSITGDAHSIPSTHLEYADGQALKAWIEQGNAPKGQLTQSQRIEDAGKADRIASFSSRGPNPGGSVNIEGILKPDVTAPGVDIVAAAAAGTGSDFAFLSGTSMATPHVTGAAALVIGARSGTLAAKGPLRVDQVISALTSTARPSATVTDGLTPASVFDQGAGVVDVSKAVRAGLYLPSAASPADGIPDFVSAKPNTGGDVRKLNLPSLTDPDCFDTCQFKRKLTAYGGSGSWQATVEGLPAGVNVSVNPNSFTLANGASQVITVDVAITAPELLGNWAFGALRVARSPASSSVADLRLPLAVKRSIGNVPGAITRTVSGDAGFFDVPITGMNTLPDARFAGSALAAPVQVNQALAEDPDNDPYNGGSGVTFRPISVPPGPGGAPASYRLTVDLASATSVDMDLYVGSDFDGNSQPSEAEELCSSGAADANEQCVLEITHPGGNFNLTYWWLVQNFTASPSGSDTANVTSVLVPLDAADSGLTVTGPGKTGKLEPYTLRVAWDDPSFKPGQTRKGFALLAPTPGNVVARIPVTLIRDSTPSVARPLVNKVDMPVVVGPGEALERIFFDVPPNARSLTVSSNGGNGFIHLYAAHVDVPAANGDTSIAPAPARAQADFSNTTGSSNKSITISGAALTPGRWYVTPVGTQSTGTGLLPVSLKAEITQADPAPAFNFGHYFDPSRDGTGLFIDKADGDPQQWVMVWYTYLEDGTPTWYIIQAPVPDTATDTATDTVRGNILRVVWNGVETSFTPVGTMILNPTEAERITLSFMLDGKAGSQTLQRLGVAGCPVFSGVDLDVTGHWFSSDKPGFGYSAQLLPDQEIFAAYLYDQQGFPRWLFGQSTGLNPTTFLPMRQFVGGACPTCNAALATSQVVGGLTRTYAANDIVQIGLDADLQPPLTGIWSENLPVDLLSSIRKLCR